MPFKNDILGVRFLRDFEKRHKGTLFFGRGIKQDAQRWAAVNGRTLSTHFATLEKVITENKNDGKRLWSFYETDGTPGRDPPSHSKRKIYQRPADVQVLGFVNASRATLMAVINAEGETGPPLFVFKGVRLPYRVVLGAGREEVQICATYLPRGARVVMREQNGGVDSENIYR